ncbi:unnamed protein product [Schistosoma turkestanicum]|nr:unnamed protein product [Schistosoma turkestanicum]
MPYTVKMKSENGITFPLSSDTLVSMLSHNLELNLKPHQVLEGLTTIGHFESLRLATHLHSSCQRMPDCCDFVTWLPAELTLRIFSYLSWKSLIVCSEVNKSWLKYARHPELYRKFCMLPKWSSPILRRPQLSNNLTKSSELCYRVQEENVQNSNHSISNYLEINWLNVFKKRVCLRRNFRLGKHRIRKFNGHSGAVYCVDCDAYRIVSGSADATIRVWNIRTNAKWSVQTLRGHSDAVRCVQLLSLPHYQSNNTNNNINSYCSSSPVHCIHESIASIPCSLCKLNKTITYPNCWEPPEVLLISGSADTTLKLWRLSTTSNWSRIACTCTLQGHTDTVRCVQVWQVDDNKFVNSLQEHEDGVTCAVISGSVIISGSYDKTVILYDFDVI